MVKWIDIIKMAMALKASINPEDMEVIINPDCVIVRKLIEGYYVEEEVTAFLDGTSKIRVLDCYSSVTVGGTCQCNSHQPYDEIITEGWDVMDSALKEALSE